MLVHRLALPIALMLSLCPACGDKTPEPLGPGPSSGSPVATKPAPPDAAPVAAEPPLPPGAPDTLAGHQLAWVVDVIVARHGAVDAAEIEAHFDPSFLAQVPAAQTKAVFGQLGEQLGAMTITSITADAGGTQLLVKAAVGDDKLRIALAVEPATKKISGLLFQPDAEAGPKPKTFAEADTMLATLAPRADLLVASLDKGACKPLHQVNAKDPLALGSTFKLYVLLAVVDRILAGKLAWDTKVAVRDEWKSLPSGVTQDDPAGTELTVQTLAERMISISDNTATDHLLYTVGRKAVEAALKAGKHAKPALDIPFVSTRELFVLKLELTEAEVNAYLELGANRRRAMLDGKLATIKPTMDGVDGWKDARHIDRLEWFASAIDLCNVMATLAARGKDAKAAPLLDVLSKNPGIPLDTKKWPYIGFKGGSEPGVLNLTWLLRRDDDRWFVVTVGLNGPTALDEAKVLGFTSGVLDLAAAEGR